MPRYKSLDEMPPSVRTLFEAQFECTEDGKIVERKSSPPAKICVQNQIMEHKQKRAKELIEVIREAHTPDELLNPDLPKFIPHRPMNVGADEIALSNLNKTEKRYLKILRSRPENLWIGVHVFRLRIATNTHYTPDFATLDTDGVFTFYDSKGGWTFEDSQLKMKLVARMFPFFRWIKAELTLATRKKPERLKETVFKS
jgi:hypothetical protein